MTNTRKTLKEEKGAGTETGKIDAERKAQIEGEETETERETDMKGERETTREGGIFKGASAGGNQKSGVLWPGTGDRSPRPLSCSQGGKKTLA